MSILIESDRIKETKKINKKLRRFTMPFQYKVSEDKKVRIIIDTDAACEADDPFAIAHALMCQKFDVRAIFAEQFNREGSTRQSYEEILTVLRAMKKEVPVFMGEETKISEKKTGRGSFTCG